MSTPANKKKIIVLLALVLCLLSSFLVTGGIFFFNEDDDGPGPGPGPGDDVLPSDFDWHCYQDRYVDLIDKNKSEVEQHYLDTIRDIVFAFQTQCVLYP